MFKRIDIIVHDRLGHSRNFHNINGLTSVVFFNHIKAWLFQVIFFGQLSVFHLFFVFLKKISILHILDAIFKSKVKKSWKLKEFAKFN